MYDHSEEKKQDTANTLAPAQAANSAIAAAITVAMHQHNQHDAQLLVAAVEAVVEAVQCKDTKQLSEFIVTAVKSAVPGSSSRTGGYPAEKTVSWASEGGDQPASTSSQEKKQTLEEGRGSTNPHVISSRTERTAAAIRAAVKVAKNQQTEQDSKLLVAAVETAVKAVQSVETEEHAKLILTAVEAAVPDSEDLMKKDDINEKLSNQAAMIKKLQEEKQEAKKKKDEKYMSRMFHKSKKETESQPAGKEAKAENGAREVGAGEAAKGPDFDKNLGRVAHASVIANNLDAMMRRSD